MHLASISHLRQQSEADRNAAGAERASWHRDGIHRNWTEIDVRNGSESQMVYVIHLQEIYYIYIYV